MYEQEFFHLEQSLRQHLQQILNIFVSPTLKIIGIIFLLIGVIGNTALFIVLSNSSLNLDEFTWDAAFTVPEGDTSGWLPFIIPWLVCMTFILTGIILIISHKLRIAKIKSLLKYGDQLDAKVISNIQNFRVLQSNIPRREVIFKTNEGKLYEFKFFGEQMASLFPENSTLKIIAGKTKKAVPDPELFKKILSDDHRKEFEDTMKSKNDEAFHKWVEGAEKFEKNGDMESAASFYETALKTKKDKAIAKRLIDIYYKNKDYEKESKLREDMKDW